MNPKETMPPRDIASRLTHHSKRIITENNVRVEDARIWFADQLNRYSLSGCAKKWGCSKSIVSYAMLKLQIRCKRSNMRSEWKILT